MTGLLDHDPARLIPEALDAHVDRARGQERQELVGPLDHGDTGAVQDLREAELEKLGEAAGPVSVEVMDGEATTIQIDQDEGRARQRIANINARRRAVTPLAALVPVT